MAPTFDFGRQYLDQEQLYGLEGRPSEARGAGEWGGGEGGNRHHGPQWALLRFSQSVTAPAVCCSLPASGISRLLSIRGTRTDQCNAVACADGMIWEGHAAITTGRHSTSHTLDSHFRLNQILNAENVLMVLDSSMHTGTLWFHATLQSGADPILAA